MEIYAAGVDTILFTLLSCNRTYSAWRPFRAYSGICLNTSQSHSPPEDLHCFAARADGDSAHSLAPDALL